MSRQKDLEKIREYNEWRLSKDMESGSKTNRERFPEIAEWIDRIREHFPGAQVVWIGNPKLDSENQELSVRSSI